MFNATNARASAHARLEQLTDRFAAEWEDRSVDMTMNEREQLWQKLLDVISDPTATKAFTSEQNAQTTNGQPAALGAGSSGQPIEANEAFQAIMANNSVDQGVKHALRRVLIPNDPDHIPVGRDGTPSELVAARQERDRAKAERDDAQAELANERDANRAGSLARQLADAQAEAAVPAEMIRKDAAQSLIAAVKTAADQLKTSMLSSHIDGIDELNAAIDAANTAVS